MPRSKTSPKSSRSGAIAPQATHGGASASYRSETAAAEALLGGSWVASSSPSEGVSIDCASAVADRHPCQRLDQARAAAPFHRSGQSGLDPRRPAASCSHSLNVRHRAAAPTLSQNVSGANAWTGSTDGDVAHAHGGSAELLGQSDDDALGATQEAEPVAVFVLRDLVQEFGTVAAQAGNDVVDVLDGEHDAAYAQRVRRRVFRLGPDRRRRVELRQLDPAVAVRGPHHGDVGTDVVETDGPIHRRPLNLRLAFQLHTKLD